MSEVVPANIVEPMKQKWERLVVATRMRDDGQQVFKRLVQSYSAPVRHYHNLLHIQHCLSELDRVRTACPQVLAVEAAVWFHDIVYEPPRPDNEQRSAEVASDVLAMMGMDVPRIELVNDLIMDTRHAGTPVTDAGRFMVDIDLSGMGQSAESFDEDGRNIRIEYGHVPDAAFTKGRIELFERLLARPAIYYTEPFAKRYEASARANLSRTIQRSRHAGGGMIRTMVRIREILDRDLRQRILAALADRRGCSVATIPDWFELDDADFVDLLNDLKDDPDPDRENDPRM